MEKEYSFTYQIFTDIDQLSEEDTLLLQKARANTQNAYVPYSSFQVSAIALMHNGAIVKGTNQENASYPVGICAERVLLSTISSVQPNVAVKTIAISYHNLNGESLRPVAPCGMCRQALLEQENRFKQPIKIILSGMEGEVIIVENARQLLPFNFSAEDML
ncbi:cytidine deaminase [Arachidicoccus sp.]|jgi:cytidine deaminase|uniref:cytidine deaminase n=1 Tax=Arachidicoccus sp. TaxID=1872624 RepID=UPI003D251B1D